jgi:hypothetical protein
MYIHFYLKIIFLFILLCKINLNNCIGIKPIMIIKKSLLMEMRMSIRIKMQLIKTITVFININDLWSQKS